VSVDGPEPGDLIAGRFRLHDKLGGGGMGNVFRATQENLGREVALKVMLPHVAAQPGARARFTREAQVAAALRHPGSVEIYDVGEDDGVMFIAMELLRGRTLRTEVQPNLPPLPISRALDIGFQVADVLAAAHAIALVHRDIKPENLFLEPAGPTAAERVVVVDFGLAFLADHARLGRMTFDGEVAGTLPYLSPEQARSGTIGPESDVYALGCMLYEMLSAHPPFVGDEPIVLTRHLFVPPTPLRRARPELEVPVALDELILRMLAKDAKARPAAADVRTALAAIDPEATEKRQRARSDRGLTGRAARMISLPPGTPPVTAKLPEPGTEEAVLRVRVVGACDDALVTALAANGLLVDDGGEPAAVYAPAGEPEALAQLAAAGAPVISDAAPGDLARVRELLRSGVAEVVLHPATGPAVAEKILRALKRRGRAR
jgi:serine/threonine-protein kinase